MTGTKKIKSFNVEDEVEGMTNDKMIPVKKINFGNSQNTVLVEWVDAGVVYRGFIPAKEFNASGVPEHVLLSATPYGLPWAKLIEFSATPEKVETMLHNSGIWTLEELNSNPQAAIGAIQAAYHIDYAALRNAAKNYKQEASK